MTWEILSKFCKGTSGVDGAPIQMHEVTDSSVVMAESKLGVAFPDQLKIVWKTVGCGNVSGSLDGTKVRDFGNVLLAPDLVADAIMRRGLPFFYNGQEGDVPFVYAGDGDFVVLSTRPDGSSFVYVTGDFDKTPIADSVFQFLDRLLIDPDYYLYALVGDPPPEWLGST